VARLLSCKTRKVKSRAALALRLGANSLCRAKGYFGEFFRRMRAKLGNDTSDLVGRRVMAARSELARIRRKNSPSSPWHGTESWHLAEEQEQHGFLLFVSYRTKPCHR